MQNAKKFSITHHPTPKPLHLSAYHSHSTINNGHFVGKTENIHGSEKSIPIPTSKSKFHFVKNSIIKNACEV
jgi:hypothetical protein